MIEKKDGEVWLNQRIVRVDTKKELSKNWLLYFFQTENYHRKIKETATGSTVRHSSNRIVGEMKIYGPSSEEQNKISTFLKLIDDRIILSMKTIEKYQSLMKSLRFRIFNDKKLFDSQVKLQNIGTFFSGGTPLTSNKNYYDGHIPFIKSGEINSDKTDQFISEEGLKNSSAKLVNQGDILFALYGATSGEVAISKISGAINQAVLCIRTKRNSAFIVNYLKFQQQAILKKFLQGGQGNLSAEIVKSITIPITSKEKEVKIVNLFSSIENKIELETEILSKLEKQKRYFLQNLFV